MIRNTFFALLTILAVAATSQAAVIVTADAGIATPGLAGYKTYQLTATSDVPGETIQVFDFIGDPDNNDPLTARGFFGQLGQKEPFGSPTVFNNSNNLFVPAGFDVLQDSQFKFNSTTDVNSPTGFFKESTSSLRALFGKDGGFGQSSTFAQLVLPDAAAGSVNYRGVFSVFRNNTIEDLPEISGVLPLIGGLAPAVADLGHTTTVLNEVVNLMPTDSVPGTPPVVWSALSGPTYTPMFGAHPSAPGLALAPTWNPATQQFSWDTEGSTRGRYVWTGTASNDTGSDGFSLTVDQTQVPEPATLSLLGLALVGFVGIARKRS